MKINPSRNAQIIIIGFFISIVLMLVNVYAVDNAIENNTMLWYVYLMVVCLTTISLCLINYMKGIQTIFVVILVYVVQIALILCFEFRLNFIAIGVAIMLLCLSMVFILISKTNFAGKEIISKNELKKYSSNILLSIVNFNTFCNCLCLIGLSGFILFFCTLFFKIIFCILLGIMLLLICAIKQIISKKFFSKKIKTYLMEYCYIILSVVLVYFTSTLFTISDQGLGLVIILIVQIMGEYLIFDRKSILNAIAVKIKNIA